MVERMWRVPAKPATTEPELGDRASHRKPPDDIDEPSADERATLRQTARVQFRAYCIACGRSAESALAPTRLSRCRHCGGTMLVEPATT